MRLIRCHIENFGCLHDLTVEFESDFHLIAEPNGWEKSTLAAFIRVMFFGFEGESGPRGTENERRRYEPRQGGAFGGQITFETGGKTYTAARIFSDRKANDGFELRDAQTNLKSTDFSEALGEEIFQINGESFARTAFIGQDDCAACTTDRIGDLRTKCGEYLRLCAACTQTEEDCRRAGERFPGEVPSEEDLKTCLDACAEMEQAERGMQTYALTGEEQEELWKLEAGEYEEDASEREAACGEEPVDPEDGGERSEEPDEESDEKPDEESDEKPDGESDEKPDEEPDEELPAEREPRKVWLALFVAGIVLVVAGLIVFLFFVPIMPWLIAATAGVVLIAAARMIHRTDLKKSEEENAQLERMRQTIEKERAARQEALARERAAGQEVLEREETERRKALERERAARLAVLTGKRENYQIFRTQYAQRKTFLEDQIRRMGPEAEDLMTGFSHYYGILTGTEDDGAQRGTDCLSRGYQDLAGLCMRLALADAVYPEEKPFLLLDDPFVNLDEENRAGAKRLMEDVTRHYQVICFTCRG